MSFRRRGLERRADEPADKRAEKGAKAGLFRLSFSLLCRSQSPAYDKVGEANLGFWQTKLAAAPRNADSFMRA